MARDQLAVHDQLLYSLFHMMRIFHMDGVAALAESAGQCEIAEIRRDAWVDGKPLVGGHKSQDVLRDIDEGPGGSAGEPAVFCLPVAGCICAYT